MALTFHSLRQAADRSGEIGSVVAVGLTAVGTAALVVLLYPAAPNMVVGIAFFVGMLSGDIAWSWIRSRPMFWRRPPPPRMRRRFAFPLIVVTILATWGVLELSPIRTFVGWNGTEPQYIEYPAVVLLNLALAWLVVLFLAVLAHAVNHLRAK